MDKLLFAFIIFVSGTLTFSSVFAAPAPGIEGTPRSETLLRDLRNRKNLEFGAVLKSWETKHGSRAVPALLAVAKDRKQSEHDRYAALMGAAKLGGKPVAPHVATLLKDRSWMLRSGALRALRAIGGDPEGIAAISLLTDPALVVRSEAVKTVASLRPPGTETALAEAVVRSDHFHGGKALWVVGQALSALDDLGAEDLAVRSAFKKVSGAPSPGQIRWVSAVAKLKKGLELAPTDPRYLSQLTATLDRLAGEKPSPKTALKTRVARWKIRLSNLAI